MGKDAEYHLQDFSLLQISTTYNQQLREAQVNVNGSGQRVGFLLDMVGHSSGKKKKSDIAISFLRNRDWMWNISSGM